MFLVFLVVLGLFLLVGLLLYVFYPSDSVEIKSLGCQIPGLYCMVRVALGVAKIDWFWFLIVAIFGGLFTLGLAGSVLRKTNEQIPVRFSILRFVALAASASLILTAVLVHDNFYP